MPDNYDLSGEISDFFLETRRKKTVQSFLQKLEDEMEDKKCEIDPKMEYKRDELPYGLNCGAEINNFELIIFCPYCGIKIVSSEDEPDTDEENDVDDRNEDDNTLPKVAKVAFCIMRLFQTLVDFDDEDIKTLFDEEEWKELTKDPIRIPPIPHEIAKELTKYRKKILKELRAVIIALYLKEKEEYDVNKHYEREWIQMTLRTLCNLYENVDAPLIRSQYEDWFTVALFGTCIDFCIRDIQLGTDIKRTDAPSLSSANRKNRGRKAIHVQESSLVPSKEQDPIQAVDYDDQKASKIQRACGLIYIFRKDPLSHNVDSKISEMGVRSFLKLLVSIYHYKVIIKDNLQVLNIRNSIKPGDKDNLYNELIEVGNQGKKYGKKEKVDVDGSIDTSSFSNSFGGLIIEVNTKLDGKD
ncbi:23863_t:CDS:10 [Gigaspora margarita]|uniref:23863_t:CDS:1 n=1 Tax=Gigaspora margarita TaxID=4874 RepID=A0ABN7V4K7_GIGMA|nr:23863_t:CDS:10 [Gigaspora margarita]